MIPYKSNIIIDEKQENSQFFYTRITDQERTYYRAFGLKNQHIDLLKRLCMFAKQGHIFQVSNTYLQNYLGISSRTTVYSYLKKLKESGFISINILNTKIDGKIRKIRHFNVFTQKLLCSNSEHLKLKTIISKAEIKPPQKPVLQKSSKDSLKQLTKIFETKIYELGYKLSSFDIENEAHRFNEYYKTKGFERWTQANGKRLTYRAVAWWIVNDKYSVFKDFRDKIKQKEQSKKILVFEKEKIKAEKQREQIELKYGDIQAYHIDLITQNYKERLSWTDEQITDKIKKRFKDDPRLDYYLNN